MPRATACSSSTIRIVAATDRCYIGLRGSSGGLVVRFRPTTTPEAQFRMSTARTSARPTLSAVRRDVTGKKVALLRRDGRLPAVVFGNGLDSDNVSVDAKEFETLRHHAGPNTLIDLSVDGRKSDPVLVHGVQHHPVTRK